MIQFFRIKFTANNYSGRVGYPVFWFSSSNKPIKLPITQRSNGGNLFYALGFINTNPLSCLCLPIMTRAETLIKHKCEWFNINILTQTSGGNFYKITSADITNAISNSWSSYMLPNKIDKPTTATIDDTMECLDILFTQQKIKELLNSIPELTAKGEAVISEIVENSFVLAIIPTDNNLTNTGAGNYGYISRSGSGYGCRDTDVIFQCLKIGKVAPRAFIHTNNSYANLFSSPSVCVTSMKIAFNSLDDTDLKDVLLPPCQTGLTENSNRGDTKFTASLLATTTDYIPLSSRKNREWVCPVYTSLDFKGNINTNLGNIANKAYVDKSLDLAKLSLVDFGRL